MLSGSKVEGWCYSQHWLRLVWRPTKKFVPLPTTRLRPYISESSILIKHVLDTSMPSRAILPSCGTCAGPYIRRITKSWKILSFSVLSGIFSVMPLFLKESIRQISQNSWLMGSMVCERTNTKRPDNVIAAWEEDQHTYILRTPKDNEIASPPLTELSDTMKIVHEGGTLSVVWTIGRQVFCKVKIRIPNQESEANTIRFVQKVAPQISKMPGYI